MANTVGTLSHTVIYNKGGEKERDNGKKEKKEAVVHMFTLCNCEYYRRGIRKMEGSEG